MEMDCDQAVVDDGDDVVVVRGGGGANVHSRAMAHSRMVGGHCRTSLL